jgi:hypothetical protein
MERNAEASINLAAECAYYRADFAARTAAF